jgi:hypothetical protein
LDVLVGNLSATGDRNFKHSVSRMTEDQ